MYRPNPQKTTWWHRLTGIPREDEKGIDRRQKIAGEIVDAVKYLSEYWLLSKHSFDSI